MNSKKLVVNILVAIFMVIMLLLIYKKIPEYESERIPVNNQEQLDNILISNEINQKFVAWRNNLSYVELKVSSISDDQDGNLKISILDKYKKIIQEKDIDLKNISKDSIIKIDLDIQKESKGEQYYVVIKPYTTNNEGRLDLFATSNTLYENDLLSVDGKKVNKSIIFNTYYKSSKIEILKDSISKIPVNTKLVIIIILIFISSLCILVFNYLNI